ncbi:MAG: hypothetical protein ISR65_03550 [Bacteriovoracaceae bacterium]|nr:hypothetical protein [Bacteriovoracaceae bacterium]
MEEDEDKDDDLTRLEDISDFLHEEDPTVNAALSGGDDNSQAPKSDINDLPDMPQHSTDEDTDDYQQDYADDDDDTQDYADEDDTDAYDQEDGEYADEYDEEQNFDSEAETQPEIPVPDLDEADTESASEVEPVSESVSESVAEEEPDPGTQTETETVIQEPEGAPAPPPPPPEETATQTLPTIPATPAPATIPAPVPAVVSQPELPAAPAAHTISADILDKVPKTAAPANIKQVDFRDLKEFATNITYGTVTTGGNPPFSIILKNVKYLEDSEAIIEILKEHGFITSDNEQDILQGLSHGTLLISQISEYSAIYLTHQLRRFDLDVICGLSDELRPSKSYGPNDKGLVSKENIMQNRKESLDLENSPIELDSILMATTPTLEDYKIIKYLGIISENETVDQLHLNGKNFSPVEHAQTRENNNNNSLEDNFDLDEVYNRLTALLQMKALKMKGNAVVGISYQLTPLMPNALETMDKLGADCVQYKVTCTGNVVRIAYTGENNDKNP